MRAMALPDANGWLFRDDLYTSKKTATVFKSKLLRFSIENCYSFSASITVVPRRLSVHPTKAQRSNDDDECPYDRKTI